MHLPIAHLSGFEEDPSEELQAQLQANSGSHSHEDEEGSQSQSQSQGSKEGSGGSAPTGKPPKDLPCPRCQSMNTKFCYYNNYSVNQPRHFCRNCQRYWTVGGTLRNVPVGGSSRKKSRTRSRSDPYYRPGASPAPAGSDETEARHGHHPGLAPAMADMAPLHPDAAFGDGGCPEFPFHPSQLSNILQFALHPSHGLGFAPFLDPPGFPMSSEEVAELQAFYEASQSGYLGNAAAVMGSGLFFPELEPAHLALMQKAALWAEAQRLQSMARRAQSAQAAAWADQERECKPVVSPPVLQQRSPAVEELRQRQHAASLHRRPGFWETALMHSRPSSKQTPAGASQTWEETKPALTQGDNPAVDEEGATRDESAAYSQGYDESASWDGALNNGPDPEMYY